MLKTQEVLKAWHLSTLESTLTFNTEHKIELTYHCAQSIIEAVKKLKEGVEDKRVIPTAT